MASESRYQENYHFATSHPEAVAREMARLDDEIATLRAENEKLRAALEQIKALPGEINPSNYDHNDVETLNNAFIEAYHIARAALQQEKSHDR
ncbi:hypothetical protein [Flavobacterium sp.]|jgi:hypothetical protein|uniref:hypothetical protein n=1 Tax=Flavobacterium sp. TaxID=239 RepID=UPI0037BFE329